MNSKNRTKKKYSSPKLTIHGEAKKLTLGSSGQRNDGTGPHTRQ